MFTLGKKIAPVCAAAAMVAATISPSLAAPVRAGGTITMWSYVGPKSTAAIQQLANQWARGKGVTVKVLVNPYASVNPFQGFSTVAKSGKGPDIGFALPHDNLGTFQLAGLISPVPAGTFNPSQYVSAAVQGVTFGGKYYGAPLNMGTYELVYNTKLIKTAPKTWDQLFMLAKKFPNTKGKTFGFFEDWTIPYFSYSIIRGFGGYFLKQTKNGTDVNDIGVATPGAIKALTFIQNMYKSKFIPSDVNSNIAGSLFQKGQLAMWIDGTWDIGANQTALGKNFAAETLPTLPGGLAPHPFSSIYCAFVNAQSHQQSMDWDLIKYLQTRYPVIDVKLDGNIPVEKGLLDSSLVRNDAIVAAYARTALVAEPIPNVPQMQAVWGPVQKQITLLSTGKVTPQQAAQNMLQQIKQGETQFGT